MTVFALLLYSYDHTDTFLSNVRVAVVLFYGFAVSVSIQFSHGDEDQSIGEHSLRDKQITKQNRHTDVKKKKIPGSLSTVLSQERSPFMHYSFSKYLV